MAVGDKVAVGVSVREVAVNVGVCITVAEGVTVTVRARAVAVSVAVLAAAGVPASATGTWLASPTRVTYWAATQPRPSLAPPNLTCHHAPSALLPATWAVSPG